MRLKDLGINPPGTFRYTQPQSGFPMSGITFPSLLQKVSQHRINMGYPLVGEGFPTLGAEVENAICESLSPINQAAYCELGVRARTHVNWKETLASVGKVGLAWARQGFKRVAKEEAERRALICKDCPFNVAVSGCPACRAAVHEARAHLFKASTSVDSALQSCGVCGCDLKMIVHVPLDVLQAGENHKFPSFCWQAPN